MAVEAHLSQILRCVKGGSAFRQSQILVLFKQIFKSLNEMSPKFPGYSPDSKFTVDDTSSRYTK